MHQPPQELPAERRVTFKLAQADDTSFLHQALDNYATSMDGVSDPHSTSIVDSKLECSAARLFGEAIYAWGKAFCG